MAIIHKLKVMEYVVWAKSGFRADNLHGKIWAERDKTPVVN